MEPLTQEMPQQEVIPVLPQETFDQLRRELNLDYYKSLIKTGEAPAVLLRDFAVNIFGDIANEGGNLLEELITR